MLQVTEINDAAALAELRGRWSDLVEHSQTADFFQTPEWLTAWLNSFWRDRPLAFLFVERGDELVGLVPLLQDELGDVKCQRSLAVPLNLHSKRAEILHAGEPDAVLDAVFDHLRATRRGVRLCLRRDSARTRVADAMRDAAGSHHLATLATPASSSPVIRVQTDWQSYLSTRSRHLRKELGRKRRKLERGWNVEHVTATTPDETERALTDVFRIERNSWKARVGTSFLSEPGVARFYTGLARRCAGNGWLRIDLLYLDGDPVAYIYSVEHGAEHYALKTSYDEAFQHWSPGQVLFFSALEQWFGCGVDLIDLLGTDARWKDELCNDARDYVDVCVFSRNQLACEWCAFRNRRVKPLLKDGLAAITRLRNRLGPEAMH